MAFAGPRSPTASPVRMNQAMSTQALTAAVTSRRDGGKIRVFRTQEACTLRSTQHVCLKKRVAVVVTAKGRVVWRFWQDGSISVKLQEWKRTEQALSALLCLRARARTPKHDRAFSLRVLYIKRSSPPICCTVSGLLCTPEICVMVYHVEYMFTVETPHSTVQLNLWGHRTVWYFDILFDNQYDDGLWFYLLFMFCPSFCTIFDIQYCIFLSGIIVQYIQTCTVQCPE